MQSTVWKLVEALAKKGEATLAQLAVELPGVKAETIRRTVNNGVKLGVVEFVRFANRSEVAHRGTLPSVYRLKL